MSEALHQNESPASVADATAGRVLGNPEHSDFTMSVAFVEAEAVRKSLQPSISANHQLALELAEVCPVFAADPTPKEDKPDQPKKTPLFVRSWPREATNNPTVHARWWGEQPDALVALPCVAANILVVDCDVKGGVDGVGAFEALVRECGLPSGFVKVRTLSGGVHYIFAQPDGDPLGNSPGSLPAGIDIRGAGGFIIAPGTCWRGGSWQEVEGSPLLLDALRDGTLPPPPEWLLERLRGHRAGDPLPRQGQEAFVYERASQSDCERVGERERAYAASALVNECNKVAGAPEGGRNNTLNEAAFSLGTAVGAGWLSRSEAEGALTQAAAACGLPKAEADKTIKSGLDAGELKPRGPIKDEVAPGYSFELSALLNETKQQRVTNGAVPELEIINAASLADRPIPPQRWHVRDLIPAANVTILSGDGGAGKSQLALQLAESTAIGGSWIGLQPEFGKALFVSAEDEIEEIHRRLARIQPNMTLLENLEIVPLAGKEAIIAAPEGRDGLLKETPLFGKLKGLVKQHKPVLLVLDTLADLFGGDEIKKVHARQFIALLRGLALEHDCAIVLLSHPSQSGMASGSGTSGNVAWNNSVRSRLYFERVVTVVDGAIVEDDPDLRKLTLKKNNRARAGEAIFVRWVDGQFVREASLGDGTAADLKLHADAVFLSLLEQFEREGREVSCKPSANYAPAVFSKHEAAKGVGKRALTYAMNRLFEEGRIKNESYGPPSRLRSKIVVLPQYVVNLGVDGANE